MHNAFFRHPTAHFLIVRSTNTCPYYSHLVLKWFVAATNTPLHIQFFTLCLIYSRSLEKLLVDCHLLYYFTVRVYKVSPPFPVHGHCASTARKIDLHKNILKIVGEANSSKHMREISPTNIVISIVLCLCISRHRVFAFCIHKKQSTVCASIFLLCEIIPCFAVHPNGDDGVYRTGCVNWMKCFWS